MIRTKSGEISSAKRVAVAKRDIRNDVSLYFLSLPGVIWFFVFSYIPMFGIIIAFKKFNISKGILGSEWVGLSNFRFFFTSGALGRVLYNTLFLNFLFIVFTTVTAVLLAVLLNEIRLRYFKRVAQSIIFLPYFMSWVVISMLAQAFLGGVATQQPIANRWLTSIGLEAVNWYAEPHVWPWLLTFLKVWQSAGYLSIIYLAAITGIPEDLYESARLDGASSTQLALRITLPLLVPTMIILTLLAIGRIFYGDFAMIYALVGDNGLLFPTTDVIDTYVFRALRQYGDLGMAAAVGLFQSVIGFILVIVANWAARRHSEDTALF